MVFSPGGAELSGSAVEAIREQLSVGRQDWLAGKRAFVFGETVTVVAVPELEALERIEAKLDALIEGNKVPA